MLNTIRIKLIELLKGIPQEYIYIYSGLHPESFVQMLKSDEIKAESGYWYSIKYVAKFENKSLQLKLLSVEKANEQSDKYFHEQKFKVIEDLEKQEMTPEEFEKFEELMDKQFPPKRSKYGKRNTKSN